MARRAWSQRIRFAPVIVKPVPWVSFSEGELTCAWRINRIKRLSEFGTSLDSASATGTNRDQLVIQLLPQAVPAGALPAPHAFDGRYSNVEKRLASPPDRLWSRIRCGRDTRD